jgi:hypothetical protein
MATLQQYYETDFSHSVRVHGIFTHEGENIEGVVLYDLSAHSAFLTCRILGVGRTYDFFVGFMRMLQYGSTTLHFASKITLPAAKQFPGALQIQNNEQLGIEYQFFGDPTWKSGREITATRRVFIYSDTDLSSEDIVRLQAVAETLGHKLQFRDAKYVQGRTKFETPLAFISHDSRDKEGVARPIATTLQRMLCPVWYDEFSLKVGDHLRESIEKGLRECKRCILVLSPNFFANNGWTKKEFDSIFTREVIEEANLVLPVWHGVTKHQVYEYSPSLLNVKGLDWNALGEEETCRQLHKAIVE